MLEPRVARMVRSGLFVAADPPLPGFLHAPSGALVAMSLPGPQIACVRHETSARGRGHNSWRRCVTGRHSPGQMMLAAVFQRHAKGLHSAGRSDCVSAAESATAAMTARGVAAGAESVFGHIAAEAFP
jgi:hypothetical protein